VPEKTAYLVERFGRFSRVLGSGLHFLIPMARARARCPSASPARLPPPQQLAPPAPTHPASP